MTPSSVPTMSEIINVDVDPLTAFKVFTEELDQWWGNGPIDAWDSSRVVGRRIESGIGGRLLEVYADDVLELGRVTVWEPGTRVSWTSSVDDVTIDVTFEPLAGGRTRVRVSGTATGPSAKAGFAYVRMTPQWLPRHLVRRAEGRQRPALGRLHIMLRYSRPTATAQWLVDAFGLETSGDLPNAETDPAYSWVEFRVGDGSALIVLCGLDADATVSATEHLPFVFVDDLDAHLTRSEAFGATIVSPITHHGFRSYTAADCEGRHWLFAQAPPNPRNPTATPSAT
jgi:hypothetical protein